YSPDGTYLAVGTTRGNLLIWELSTTQKVAQIKIDATPNRLKFSPDGRLLVVGCFQHGLELFDWQPPKLTPRGPPLLRVGTPSDMHFDGQAIMAVEQGQGTQRLCRCDLTTGECRPLFPVDYKQVIGLGPWYSFSRDGQLLATCSNSVAIVWEIPSKTKL